MGSVEYVAPIYLLVDSCLDVDSVETMAAFREKIKTDHVALEERSGRLLTWRARVSTVKLICAARMVKRP